MTFREFSTAEAREFIPLPTPDDDKYSRGVLGVITGSEDYPGAAVLGVEAAIRTGVGMVRYLGAERPTLLVLHRRPEVVTVGGRVQAWLVGSGMDTASRDPATTARLRSALEQPVPVVIDAGALDLIDSSTGPAVMTPHHGELARMFGVQRAVITADPAGWAVRAAEQWGATVLLKGAQTFIADSSGCRLSVRSSNGFTATAGAGDALGGILGALVATRRAENAAERHPVSLARLAATAAVIHREAAHYAGAGGPFAVLDLAAAVSGVVAGMIGFSSGALSPPLKR